MEELLELLAMLFEDRADSPYCIVILEDTNDIIKCVHSRNNKNLVDDVKDFYCNNSNIFKLIVFVDSGICNSECTAVVNRLIIALKKYNIYICIPYYMYGVCLFRSIIRSRLNRFFR